MGWLSAIPEGQKETRAELYGERLPDIPGSEVLIDYWRELGCARLLSDGALSRFEWQEVNAFIAVSKYDITPEQAFTLVDMSAAYVAAYNDKRPHSIAPMDRNK